MIGTSTGGKQTLITQLPASPIPKYIIFDGDELTLTRSPCGIDMFTFGKGRQMFVNKLLGIILTGMGWMAVKGVDWSKTGGAGGPRMKDLVIYGMPAAVVHRQDWPTRFSLDAFAGRLIGTGVA